MEGVTSPPEVNIMGKDLKGKELGKGIKQRADRSYEARFTAGWRKQRQQTLTAGTLLIQMSGWMSGTKSGWRYTSAR